MDNLVFSIKQLVCEYVPGQPVLKLENLAIPAGQLIFVIGKSGIGKSTFIETLGLMNKTIAPEEETSLLFFDPSGGECMELKHSWSFTNQTLADFRNNHFSFIFQNTNLMPNFSSGENMMMSLLIKGKPIEKAKQAVLRVMNRLSLPEEVFDKKISALSGGQRQRLAFVRAVTANFSVLFGDEPTGNLDEHTAEELMAILKSLIQEENKTGIIVSHDLRLAARFADMIIPITQREGQSFGIIEQENIIHQKNGVWSTEDDQPIMEITPFLNQYLSVTNKTSPI